MYLRANSVHMYWYSVYIHLYSYTYSKAIMSQRYVLRMYDMCDRGLELQKKKNRVEKWRVTEDKKSKSSYGVRVWHVRRGIWTAKKSCQMMGGTCHRSKKKKSVQSRSAWVVSHSEWLCVPWLTGDVCII